MALQPQELRSFIVADREKFFVWAKPTPKVGGLASFGKKFRTSPRFLRRADAPQYVDDIVSYIRRFR